MRKLISLGVTALVVAASSGTAVAQAAAPERSSALVFGACPADIATPYPHLTCANVRVPVDYANPAAGTTTLLISKSAATDPAKRRGVMLMDPGGPGRGGADYIGRLTQPDASGNTRLPAKVLAAYDVIGLDPRGVAHSSPISCVDPSFWAGPQPDPDASANRLKLWKQWGDFSAACARNAGPLLAHMGTRDVAQDMDQIRAQLGESKISYLGFSYGAYLGAVYATLFPGRVDRMILDGNVDPTPERLWYKATLAQNEKLQKRHDAWLSWVATYDDVFHLGTTLDRTRAAWNATLAEFRATPHGEVGGSELLSLAYGSAMSESLWIPLAQALSDYVVNHDDSMLVAFAAPSADAANENYNAAYNAIICRDAPFPAETIEYERDAGKSAQTSQFAYLNMWTSGSACASWTVPSRQRVLPTGAGLPPILMFNSVDDAATPYEGALKMHQALPSSVLVTELDSGKHTVFAGPFLSINPAAQRIGADYLVDGKLPSGDISIPGHALPVPTAASAASARESVRGAVPALPGAE
ncbi:alpha/beta hydrolase [Nonomuraea sp. NPDC050783]|uniref:alpha/beta hydrolase n=1 Tax=Nonomuraea sp. NPDC050783 TaxID=3154634 RepID=UPI00346554CF